MNEKISKIVSERSQFFERLEKDFGTNLQLENEAATRLEHLENMVKNITELGKQPEHIALIPLAKNIFLPGRIIHTGEYYVEKKSYPESYHVLQTLSQTIKSLESKILEQKEVIKKIEISKEQLKERMNLLAGVEALNIGETSTDDNEGVTEDMPEQIESDRGVAMKVGGFYEIIEQEQ